LTTVNRLFRVLIALLGIAVLTCAAYEAGRRGLADWVSMRARFQVASWTEKRTVPSREQWERAVDALGAALKLTPEDPSLYDHLGVAYDLAAAAFDPKGQWNVYTEFALLHFQQAAILRPTSPYSRASIAMMKFRLGQVDEELFRALALATRLGPWEPQVQIMASDLGLALWDRLDADQKGQIRENWRRTAVRQADQLWRLAVARKRVDLLCKTSLDALKNRLECIG